MKKFSIVIIAIIGIVIAGIVPFTGTVSADGRSLPSVSVEVGEVKRVILEDTIIILVPEIMTEGQRCRLIPTRFTCYTVGQQAAGTATLRYPTKWDSKITFVVVVPFNG